MAKKKQRFGRYLILDHLINGGMAKICRARYLGEQADRIVAMKMVQSQYSNDESFRVMFLDEIKVTFGLLHPNIVQIYDYGHQDGQLYVAMEYCDGRNLKEYLDKLKEKKFVFPVEISVYIITQVCQGLNYAHSHTDKLTGKAANIVHRDISPHNIMLTFDGAIKIIDFGIAKAETNSEATQAGTIKGKLSYLAPEYLENLELDHRYDQFAVGITLWEMLCSQKLFKARNDLAVLKKIQECDVRPPSSINPNVPKELDEIVLRALSRNREKRYENMDQLNRALNKYLFANYPDFNSSDLSFFAKELFKDEIKKDRARLVEYGQMDITEYLEDLKKDGNHGHSTSAWAEEPSSPVTETKKGDQTKTEKTRSRVTIFDFDKDNNRSNEPEETKGSILVKEKRKANFLKKRKSSDLTSLGNMEVNSAQNRMNSNKSISKKGRGRGRGSDKILWIAVVFVGMLIYPIVFDKKLSQEILSVFSNGKKALARSVAQSKTGNNDKVIIKKDVADNSKNKKTGIDEDPILDDPADGNLNQNNPVDTNTVLAKLRLVQFDKYTERIFINGERQKVDYLDMIQVPRGREFFLRVESSRLMPHVEKLVIKDSEETYRIPRRADADFGHIITSRNCVQGRLKFELFGEQRTEILPIKNRFGVIFPITGDGRHPANEKGDIVYQLTYQKEFENFERKIEVVFNKSGQRIDLCSLIKSKK